MEQLKAWAQKFVIINNEWCIQIVSPVENIPQCYLLSKLQQNRICESQRTRNEDHEHTHFIRNILINNFSRTFQIKVAILLTSDYT